MCVCVYFDFPLEWGVCVCVCVCFDFPLIRLSSWDFKSGINQKARVLGSNIPVLVNSNSSLE